MLRHVFEDGIITQNYRPDGGKSIHFWKALRTENTKIIIIDATGEAIAQSQKTQGFCVADFATLSGERRPRSKNFPLFIWIKEPCVRKFEGLERSKLLGISQTIRP